MSRPSWAPPGLDLSRPSAARVYDYYLGGSHNFEVDRRMAEEAIRLWPELPRMMQANRDFMRRAVRYLVGQGITQFIDIGSGIPTAGNVHEVAQRENPQTNVVYVDNDPVAVAHSRAILADVAGTTVVEADFRNPGVIFDDPAVRELIDFNRPAGGAPAGGCPALRTGCGRSVRRCATLLRHAGVGELPGDLAREFRWTAGCRGQPPAAVQTDANADDDAHGAADRGVLRGS